MKLKFIIDKEYDRAATKFMYGDNKQRMQYFEEQYKTASKYLKLTKKLYQDSWDEINDDFSKYVEKTTGYNWFYKTYECVISVINPGIVGEVGDPKIVRTWQENPYYMRRITAHELILSHYFEIYERHYKKENLTNGQVWALAEIAAYALTSLKPEVRKFWPWSTKYDVNNSYPQILTTQNKLKSVFLKSNNFDEYIIKGIELIRKYPDMGPKMGS